MSENVNGRRTLRARKVQPLDSSEIRLLQEQLGALPAAPSGMLQADEARDEESAPQAEETDADRAVPSVEAEPTESKSAAHPEEEEEEDDEDSENLAVPDRKASSPAVRTTSSPTSGSHSSRRGSSESAAAVAHLHRDSTSGPSVVEVTGRPHRSPSSAALPELPVLPAGAGGETLSELLTQEVSLEKVESLLLAPNSVLLQAVVSAAGQEDVTSVGEALLRLFCYKRFGRRLVVQQVQRELGLPVTVPDSLFRGHSFAAVFISMVLRQRCQDWLTRLLQPIVVAVCVRNVHLEVDERRLSGASTGAELEANRKALVEYTDKFVADVVTAVELFPQSIKALFHILQTIIDGRFPGMGSTIIGSFFFLRFVCAALVTPREYDLVKSTPSSGALRSLILISKVLQNISNQLTFGEKETYLQFMNPHLERHFEKISRSLKRLSVAPDRRFNELVDLPVSDAEHAVAMRRVALFLLEREAAMAKALDAQAAALAAQGQVKPQALLAWIINGLPPLHTLQEEFQPPAQTSGPLLLSPLESNASATGSSGGGVLLSPTSQASSGGTLRRKHREDEVAALRAALEAEKAKNRALEEEVNNLRSKIQLSMQMMQTERTERYAIMRELRQLKEGNPATPQSTSATNTVPMLPIKEPDHPMGSGLGGGMATSGRSRAPSQESVGVRQVSARATLAKKTPPRLEDPSSSTSMVAFHEAGGPRDRTPSLSTSNSSNGAPLPAGYHESMAGLLVADGPEVKPNERANPELNLRPVLRRTTSQAVREQNLLPKVQLRKVEKPPVSPAGSKIVDPPSSSPTLGHSAAHAVSGGGGTSSSSAAASSSEDDKSYGLSAFRKRLSRFQRSGSSVGDEHPPAVSQPTLLAQGTVRLGGVQSDGLAMAPIPVADAPRSPTLRDHISRVESAEAVVADPPLVSDSDPEDAEDDPSSALDSARKKKKKKKSEKSSKDKKEKSKKK